MSDQTLVGFIILLAIACVIAVTLLEVFISKRQSFNFDARWTVTATLPSKESCVEKDDVVAYFDHHVVPMLADKK